MYKFTGQVQRRIPLMRAYVLGCEDTPILELTSESLHFMPPTAGSICAVLKSREGGTNLPADAEGLKSWQRVLPGFTTKWFRLPTSLNSQAKPVGWHQIS